MLHQQTTLSRPTFMRRRTAGMVGAIAAMTVLFAASPAMGAGTFGESTFDAALSGPAPLQAGGHPDLSVNIEIPGNPENFDLPVGDLRDATVDLPTGLLGDQTATPTCSDSVLGRDACPPETQVGVLRVVIPGISASTLGTPLFNMARRNAGETARLGFKVAYTQLQASVVIRVRDDSDYGLEASLSGVPRQQPITFAGLDVWGVPADPSHDDMRLNPDPNADPAYGLCDMEYYAQDPNACGVVPLPEGTPRNAFLTNPTTCGTPLSTRLRMNEYDAPNVFVQREVALGTITGCEQLPFDPSVSVAVNGAPKAGAPAGLDVAVKVPQNPDRAGLQTSHLKSTEVKLPPGVVINPPGADGLVACADADLRVGAKGASTCPNASKVGDVDIDVPVLGETLKGGIFVRPSKPGNMFRIALVASGAGVNVKIPGEIYPDPVTGQITARFENTPQVPFSELRTRFFGGSRGVLSMPRVCGGHTAQASFTPWSGGAVKSSSAAFSLDQDCAFGGFGPVVTAGTRSATAGASSPFSFRMSRGDSDEMLGGVKIQLPTGLLAKTKGVPLCTDAQVASASCPEATRVGTATTTAGAGETPLPLQGPVFLTGPYKGGPYGLAVVVRAVAGPYDLGTVIVRQALTVDPDDAHLTITSDPLPTILEGVPLQIRSVQVDVDRPGFMVSPTSCAEKQIFSTVSSVTGQSAASQQRFQASDCGRLGLKPDLQLAFTGSAEQKKGRHPGVNAVVRPRSTGDANMKNVAVTLPTSVALQPDNAKALCKPEQAAAKACPEASVVGTASAETPSLQQPLKGKVYFVEGTRRTATGTVVKTLPKLWVALRGETALDVWADTSVKDDALVTTFAKVPDAPLSRFELQINGGKNGILEAVDATCDTEQKSRTSFIGHSNRRYDRTVPITTPCRLNAYMNASATSVRFKYTGIGAGRVTVSGKGLKTTRRTVKSATVATVTGKLTAATRKRIARGQTVRLRLKASFTPKGAKKATSITKTVTIKGAKKVARR